MFVTHKQQSARIDRRRATQTEDGMISIATRAEALARSAHAAHAVPRNTAHPARVAARVRKAAPGDQSAEAVAWLHDVVSTTSVTLDDLADEFGSLIAAGVEAITRRPGEGAGDYRYRVATNRLASLVDAAAVDDDLVLNRPGHLDAMVPEQFSAEPADQAGGRQTLAELAD